jgi:hypothetical protein
VFFEGEAAHDRNHAARTASSTPALPAITLLGRLLEADVGLPPLQRTAIRDL